MGDLPRPVSVTDELLHAIHGVLGEIRDRLPEPKPEPQAGQVKVSEPGAVAKGSTKPPAQHRSRKS